MKRGNHVREIWAGGGNVVNGWLSGAGSFTAEVMASLGFDSVTADMQHGMIDFNDGVHLMQAISAQPAMPMARVPWNDPVWIMKSLDAGAMGLICPMINDAEEAAHFVGCMRYPPEGCRSYSAVRGQLYMGPDYAERANETTIAFAMIETVAGLENIEAICATKGLDAIYIGPADLSLSLGYPPMAAPVEKDVLAAIARIREAAVAHGVTPCIHAAGGEHARLLFDQGFRLCSLASDTALLRRAAEAEITLARG